MSVGTIPVDDIVLSVPSLRQHAFVKISETLINKDSNEFISLNTFPRLRKSNWRERWANYKRTLFENIQKLPIVESLKTDIRDIIMCLFCSARDYMIFYKPRLKCRFLFTPRCDVDVDRMLTYYMEHTVPNLLLQQKFAFFRDVCCVCNDQLVQLMLGDILHSWGQPCLIPTLFDGRRTVEFHNLTCNISFILNTDDPVSWVAFVSRLNRVQLKSIRFSFEQTTLKISVRDCFFKSMWNKRTFTEKCIASQYFYKVALIRGDTLRVCHAMHCMDLSKLMELLKWKPEYFVLCFLKQPFDRYFMAALQLVEEELRHNNYDRILFNLILDVALEEGFSDSRRELLFQLWQYVCFRDKALAKHVQRSIQNSFNRIKDIVHFNTASVNYTRDVIKTLGISEKP